MDKLQINKILEAYKNNFDYINDQEQYKWHAVAHFQRHWDINAVNFAEMLKESLSKAYNLLDSGQHFPKRMICNNAEKSPEEVRTLFKNLFNEQVDYIKRIVDFQQEITNLNKKK